MKPEVERMGGEGEDLHELLKGCGLLESRPANWGAFDHDAPHILYYISVCL